MSSPQALTISWRTCLTHRSKGLASCSLLPPTIFDLGVDIPLCTLCPLLQMFLPHLQSHFLHQIHFGLKIHGANSGRNLLASPSALAARPTESSDLGTVDKNSPFFQCSPHIVCWRVRRRIPQAGTTEIAIEFEHRIKCARATITSHRQELTSPKYPLRDRLKLFDATVTRSLLYASGTWTTRRNEKEAPDNATTDDENDHTDTETNR